MEGSPDIQFGQFVIGPPGSGKSTYCSTMLDFLNNIDRKTIVINLDPANDDIPYKCAINIEELVSVETVMKEYDLGPNGATLFCLETLEANLEWLRKRLNEYKGYYLLFDCPGQIELFTHHTSVKNVLHSLTFKTNLRLTTVNLVDAHHISDPTKYVSVVLVSLSCMLQLETPHINILSKVDLVQQYGELDFQLPFYTDALDLDRLVDRMTEDRNIPPKFKQLNEALCELINDFNLVNFRTLDIQNLHNIISVLKDVDKANGYIYGSMEREKMQETVEKVSLNFDEYDAQDMYVEKDNY